MRRNRFSFGVMMSKYLSQGSKSILGFGSCGLFLSTWYHLQTMFPRPYLYCEWCIEVWMGLMSQENPKTNADSEILWIYIQCNLSTNDKKNKGLGR